MATPPVEVQVAPRFIGAAGIVTLVAFVLVIFSWMDFVNAVSIGNDPGHSVIQQDFGCTGRGCSDLISFYAGTDEVTARISGPLAENVGDAVVYSRGNPQDVMLTRGWDLRWWALAAGSLLPVGFVGLVRLIISDRRRRQKKYGDLRPGIGITRVRRAAFSRPNTWVVTFADGKSVGYGNSTFGAAARTNSVPGGLKDAQISARDRARLRL